MKKKCNLCGETKVFGDFYSYKSSADGLNARCKECIKSRQREYNSRNKSVIAKKRRDYVASNKEKVDVTNAKYRNKNRLLIRKKAKDFYYQNKDKVRNRAKELYKANARQRRLDRRSYYQKNREQACLTQREYQKQNREYLNAYRSAYWKQRKQNDPAVKMRYVQYDLIRRMLCSERVAGLRTQDRLGYSPEKLVSRIECQFSPGMSWQNYGDWHIDHKIPITHFLSRGETRPHIISALSNLQPMWAFDNLSKGNRWTG